jgi:hypothetical protein
MSDWMYLQNGRTVGPVTENKIVDMLIALELDFDTNVMNSQDGLWKKIRDVKPIMDKFNTPAITMNCTELPDIDLQNPDAVEISHNIYFYIPVKRLLIMTLLSFGLYQLYWWYKQWSYWAYKRKQVRSFDREAGWFLFPLIVMDKIQIDEELNKVERCNFDGRVLFWGWILVGLIVEVPFIFLHSSQYLSPVMYASSFIMNTLFLLPAQKYINRVNTKLGNLYEPPGFGHYACLVIGALLWIAEIIHAVKYLFGS